MGWTRGRAYSNDLDGSRSGLPPPSVQPPTAAPGIEEPFTYYKPSIAISGMTFYTGDKFPQRTGYLFAGGLPGMQLSRIAFNGQGLESRRDGLLSEIRQRIRDVKQGPDEFLYLTTDMQDGTVLRIELAP
jgi:glucose/arabinose dehydrogenase